MTIYARLNNDGGISEYPYDLNDLRRVLSFRSDPTREFLAENNIVVVNPSTAPESDHTLNLTESQPELVEGEWVQTWKLEPATDDEVFERTQLQASVIKSQRNRLLSESDWTQLPDVPADLSAGWAEYRAQLRLISSQPGFPWSVEWPTPPS